METSEEKTIRQILEEYRTIAVVGLSKNPEKDSHRVARYLQSAGYRVIPVNPTAEEILGEKAYPRLSDIPFKVEVVDIFRPSAEAGAVVEEAISVGAKAVWMQLGIVNEEAAKKARNAGLDVVMDRCMMIEHRRLKSG
ncbi:MAG: CoA-binding protein [Methanobacteriota archaeon]|nr:MAG: CoA-binding protein [Euryarchaeota archaeon]